MAPEDTITDSRLDDLLAAAAGDDITPEHRAWMDEEIKKTLAKIDAGEMTFHSLEDVLREFGLDAR